MTILNLMNMGESSLIRQEKLLEKEKLLVMFQTAET